MLTTDDDRRTTDGKQDYKLSYEHKGSSELIRRQ